jgi:GT2 family glycosyltransferase
MSAVHAVVLNHRRCDQVVRCLAALDATEFPDLKVLVVDNDSGAAEVHALREAGARVVQSGGNLGYAGGNNVGIRVALDEGASFVWILNPDIEPRPPALRRMVAAMTGDPSLGIVGGRLLEDDRSGLRVQSEGGRIVWEAGGRSELIGRGRIPRRFERRRLRSVDFVPGAAMLIRRSVFERVGLLPEEYFMYFEETEYCLRAGRAGFGIAVEPRAELIHHTPRTVGMPGETFLYYFIRNRLLFGLGHTQFAFEELVADVTPFVQGWRRRVAELDPGWSDRFEELVGWAIEDARAGRTGRRDGVG